jgi:hypothetical protein
MDINCIEQVMAAIGLEAWAVKPAMYDQMDILVSITDIAYTVYTKE